MTISEILKNTSYDTSMFSDSAIKAIEENVFMKEVRGKNVPHISCLIRKKPIRLSPEEVIRQLYIHKLINEYHYSEGRISLETPIHFGREVKRADITIADKDRPDVPYIIVELKKPKLTDGKEQLKSYCNATGAPIGVWTNGEQISCYNRKDPNYFEEIRDIPTSTQKLSDIINEQLTYIDISKCRYISEEKNIELRRSELHPNDIVVTKTGVYFGKSAVITDKIKKANMIAHVGKITLKDSYNPFFVSTFLNCKYGYYQLRRRGIKATRPEIKLVEFSDVIVPAFSKIIDNCIEKIIKKALRLMDSANSIIKQCGNDIEQFIAGSDCIINSNYSIKTFSKTFGFTGRLDAEYYQPKYDRLFATLSKYTCKPLGGENGLVTIKKSIEPGSEY